MVKFRKILGFDHDVTRNEDCFFNRNSKKPKLDISEPDDPNEENHSQKSDDSNSQFTMSQNLNNSEIHFFEDIANPQEKSNFNHGCFNIL